MHMKAFPVCARFIKCTTCLQSLTLIPFPLCSHHYDSFYQVATGTSARCHPNAMNEKFRKVDTK